MQKRVPRFEQIEHTADVGIKVYGKTLIELFENAAAGLFDIIANLANVQNKLNKHIEIESSDREGLLVAWLSELNYLFLTEKILFNRFKITKLSDKKLAADAHGELLDLSKHEIYTEVKAVTYHGLYIKEKNGGWEAQIIFDL